MARRMEDYDADTETAEEDSELEIDPTIRARLIKRVRGKVKSLQAKVDTLNEDAKPHKKEISAQFRTLKSKTGLTRKEAEHLFWLADLEDDERSNTSDRLREGFFALGLGDEIYGVRNPETANGHAATGKNAQKPEEYDDETETPHNRGYTAGEHRATVADNPFKKRTKEHREWEGARQKALVDLTAEAPAASEASN